MGQIPYSEKYFDDSFEYRHVVLPPEVVMLLPRNRLLSKVLLFLSHNLSLLWHVIFKYTFCLVVSQLLTLSLQCSFQPFSSTHHVLSKCLSKCLTVFLLNCNV
ncbi:Cyclin-dependent kinases regulatory subunit 1 [Platanthera guangdongensis]|uniref:Cyclin-dependent kinases regulatory subunit n=1 Tax=Platanthera guangdongensis TaxID=2320717 RepID=A0ABR2N1W0_9ASPA